VTKNGSFRVVALNPVAMDALRSLPGLVGSIPTPNACDCLRTAREWVRLPADCPVLADGRDKSNNAMALHDKYGDKSGSQAAINARLGISDADAAKYGAKAVNATQPDEYDTKDGHALFSRAYHDIKHGSMAEHVRAICDAAEGLDGDDDGPEQMENLTKLGGHLHHALQCVMKKAETPRGEDDQAEPDLKAASATKFISHTTGKFAG
jgi:hypothetical protein